MRGYWARQRELSTMLFAELLAAHPARNEIPAQSKADEPLLGELHRRLLPEVGRGKGRLARGSDTPLPNGIVSPARYLDMRPRAK